MYTYEGALPFADTGDGADHVVCLKVAVESADLDEINLQRRQLEDTYKFEMLSWPMIPVRASLMIPNIGISCWYSGWEMNSVMTRMYPSIRCAFANLSKRTDFSHLKNKNTLGV